MAKTKETQTIGVDSLVRYTGTAPLPAGIAPDATGYVIMVISEDTPYTHLVRFEGMAMADERLAECWFAPKDLQVIKSGYEVMRGELNALRREHADLIVERNAMDEDRKAVRGVLRSLVDALKDVQEWEPLPFSVMSWIAEADKLLHAEALEGAG